ncbi:MAG: penicillin-binding protein 2 [Candidatus Omnitrophica bacterium]|nr:penicillin-binding protein 2 [Candidatus Omnitrophota bacterium]
MLTAAQKTRVALVIMGFILVTGALLSRLFWLQVLHPSHWVTIARRQHLQVLELPPTRGAILDRNLKPLAGSIRLTSVFADPRHLKNPAGTARLLAPVLKKSAAELEVLLSHQDRGFVWLARRISNQSAAQIRALRLSGVDVVMEPQRVYPQGVLASHLVGFSGVDTQGLEGLELAYDRILKGEPGWRWLARDARRRPVGTWEGPMVTPRDGLELVMTIDTAIQFIAERALDQAFQKWRAKGASIVVMNPMTGEILALANRPTFDANQYEQTSADVRRNRAVTDTFEPGSVFKIVTASVALTKGVVRPEENFYCENGTYQVAGRLLHDYRPHGWLTFRDVIAQSSNIGTTKVALRLGPAPIYEGMQAFGFGVPTGVGLPGEVGGKVKPPSQWSRPSITCIPIGQEVTVTSIQLAQAISVIANGGYLVKPWVVREIRHPSGAVVKAFKPIVVRRVIPSETVQQMREILTAVVETGSGKLAVVDGFRAAGKTGTAQKVEPSGVYSISRTMASFVGFVPAENPVLTIAVTVDEPQPLHTGGVVSAPVFQQVATETLAYLRQGELLKTAQNEIQ